VAKPRRDRKLNNETDRHDLPVFYTSHAGNPYQDRLSNSVTNYQRQLYKKVASARVVAKRNFDSVSPFFGNNIYNFLITHRHGLGYRPLVRGTYVIREAEDWDYSSTFPVGTRGQIPEYRNVAGWNVSIVGLNDNEVTVKFVVNQDVELGVLKVEIKLDFLALSNV
jgi:hypothetical protein